MARWNEQQCMTNPGVVLDTVSGASGAVTKDWIAVGTSGAGFVARKVDTVQTGWINTEFSDRIFFKFIVKNTLEDGASTYATETAQIRAQDAMTIYAEVTLTSIYGREAIEISRIPVQYSYGDQSVTYSSGDASGFDNEYASNLGTYSDPLTVIGLPALNTSISSGTPAEMHFFTGFSPNTPGAVIRGQNSGTPPINALGSTTYAELDLYFHYDNRRPASANDSSGVRYNSAYMEELNGAVTAGASTEQTKLQAQLTVVNCFAFTSNDYR